MSFYTNVQLVGNSVNSNYLAVRQFGKLVLVVCAHCQHSLVFPCKQGTGEFGSEKDENSGFRTVILVPGAFQLTLTVFLLFQNDFAL